MVREEGMHSLFRGMSTPLMSRAIVNGMCFSTYTLLMKGLWGRTTTTTATTATTTTTTTTTPTPPTTTIPTPTTTTASTSTTTASTTATTNGNGGGVSRAAPLHLVFLAGGCAGAASALIASPTELIKVQMQLGIVAGGPVKHLKVLINHSGVKGLLMLGMLPTILRDFVCMGTFFTTTTEFSRAIATRYPNSPVSHVAALLGGAMAGVAGWALCYPFDVWKSNVQQLFETPNSNKRQPSISFLAFFRERYKARGIRGFYTGLGPTLFRAIPVNATKFFAFDLVIRIFHKSEM